MSGQWCSCVAASLFVAGLSTTPAFSNPLTDLFNPAPKEAAAPAAVPAPAKVACLLQPGNATARGQHWFYRVDGHRKCWFQAPETTNAVSKPVHHYAARRPAVAPEEDEPAPRKKTVMDARAQLLSAAQANALQPTAPAPEVAEKAFVPVAADKAPVRAAAPIAAETTIDQLTLGHARPRSVDVEMLLAASTLATDMAGKSASPTAPAALPAPAQESHLESTATWAGPALIALGLVFLAGSLLGRFLGSRMAPVSRAW